MTLHQIKSMADIIHYIESVDDEELNIIPQDQYAHALKALFTDGYFAFRSFNQNVLLINSFRDTNKRI